MNDQSAAACAIPAETQYSDELLKAIGLLFVVSASTETALSFHLWRLAHHPTSSNPPAMIALQGMDTKVKLEKISLLSVLLLKRQSPEIIKICDKIRDKFQRRNEIAHYSNTPGRDPDHIKIGQIRMKRTGELESDKIYSAKQIKGFAAAMLHRSRQLDAALNDAGVRKLTAIPLPVL